MSALHGRPRTLREREAAEAERALRERVAEAAAERFACPLWCLVSNMGGRRIYGVGTGLYPDLVALDGTDVGAAWILEVATPATIAEEAVWERWRQMTATGLRLILAVPCGCGRAAERVSAILGMRPGLVYEYGFTTGGVELSIPGAEFHRAA